METQGANSAISVLTVALWVFAAVAALAGAVAIGIVLTREIACGPVRAVCIPGVGADAGSTTGNVRAAALAIAGGGAVLAVVGGIAASPLFPIGVARRADPDPGFHVDWPVLGLTIVAVGVVVFAIAMLAAVRVTRATSPH